MPKKVSFFDEVDYCKPASASHLISDPVKEPVVVTVGVEVIFDKQIKYLFFVRVDVSSADIAALEIGVDAIQLFLFAAY